ncbi:MAG: CDP-alcohol phosphatidyltransferase family protein [Chloroflexi bacterium]|nr:MAG: CDP-alcohol phosphatidyltransferase family protein [Phototrophicales bacterium]RMF82441.1 MAG: CDP-alcohol phosphatidyltransferase family protein [Chloroflexota bacterium]
MYNHGLTLSDYMRKRTRTLTTALGNALHRAGVHPDMLTIVGFIFVVIAGVFIGRGQHRLGGVLLIVGLPLDALDGAVARAMQRQDKFGEVLDSTLDRYADGIIFGALAYYFASQDALNYVLLALATMIGSQAISYIRSRAGEVGVKMKIGLFTRMERIVTIIIALLIPPLLIPGMWLLAIGTNFTALQRLWFAYKQLQNREV